jgi:hypothetical protein
MKTIVIGDIHGRTIWKDIVHENKDADRFIFLGDYVSTHDRDMTDAQQITNLMDIIDFARFENELTPGRVVLLRGNHDMQHLGYHWAECSGLCREVYKWMVDYKDTFLENTQWVFVEDNIVYSHAGVSNVWMDINGLTDINQINDLTPSEKFGFTPCKMSDYSGDSVTQPPIWIRPWGLFESAFGNYTYVVGHTSYPTVTFVRDEVLKSYKESFTDELCPIDETRIDEINNTNQIIVCDSLPNEYLIVEDGKISVGKILN